MTEPDGMGVLHFSRDTEAAVNQSALLGLYHSDRKIISQGRECEASPSRSVAGMSLHLVAMLACGILLAFVYLSTVLAAYV
jgi:hypothetical protein